MAQFCPHCVAPDVRTRASDPDTGMFGRMFPHLPGLGLDVRIDLALGAAGGRMDASAVDPSVPASSRPDVSDNPRIPAGWAFFGQILAHDVTHDRSPLRGREEVRGLRNHRTPRLDLEAVYGTGPVGQPYLYERNDGDKLLLGLNDLGDADDLPRNSEGIALVGDARDDTYLFISQLHLALLKLHNLLVDQVRAAGTAPSNVFAEAQRLTRWHYQWIILHEYLPLTVGDALVDELVHEGTRVYQPDGRPYVPVEFSAAAFRFGHAQIRSLYDVNDGVGGVPIFPDLVGQRPVAAALRPDWRRFFDVPAEPAPQASKRLDVSYPAALMHLPLQLTGELELAEHAALAYRDLQRGAAMELPSGEDVARAMGETPLDRDALGLPAGVCSRGTPLTYYVLREAEVETDGRHLGRVGGRLVAEVIIGLLRADPTSILGSSPGWRPALSSMRRTDGTEFTMADLLAATGALDPRGERTTSTGSSRHEHGEPSPSRLPSVER